MLNVENAQILSEREKAVLVNGLNMASEEWDKLAEVAKKGGISQTRVVHAYERYAAKARELALNAMSADHVIFDQGIDEVSDEPIREQQRHAEVLRQGERAEADSPPAASDAGQADEAQPDEG